MKLLKEPLLHFIIGGLALFLLYEILNPSESPNKIEITAATAQGLAENWEIKTGQKPTKEEWRSLIDAHVKEMILAKAALEKGLDFKDPIIQRRLAQKMEFIIDDQFKMDSISHDSLQAFYLSNNKRYTSDTRFSFKHLFFRKKQAMLDFNKKINGEISGLDLEWATQNNHPFDKKYQEIPISEVKRTFGQVFSDTLLNSPVQKWTGPIRSGLGWHWIYLEEIQSGDLIPFDQIQDIVERDFRYHQSQKQKAQEIEKLKANYEIQYPNELNALFHENQ